MRVIGLWNPYHLAGQSAWTSALPPTISGFWDNEVSNYTLMGLPNLSSYSWAVNSVNGRYYLIFNNLTPNNTTCIFTVSRGLSVSAYTELRAKGATRVYHGLRVYVWGYKPGATLLCTSTAGYYPITASGEYFVEVVDRLDTNTRVIYVNGAVVAPVGALTDYVGVGNQVGSMWNTSGQRFGITDYYFVVNESTDPAGVDRIGKMSVKNLLPTSVDPNAKFTVVGGTDIVSVLGGGRAAVAPNAVNSYVETDSNESKLNLYFTKPNNGDRVIGAMARCAAIVPVTSSAATDVTTSAGVLTLQAVAGNVSTATPLLTPITLPNPVAGWSEDELGKIVVSLNSRRLP